jgi:hypothetical protein
MMMFDVQLTKSWVTVKAVHRKHAVGVCGASGPHLLWLERRRGPGLSKNGHTHTHTHTRARARTHISHVSHISHSSHSPGDVPLSRSAPSS